MKETNRPKRVAELVRRELAAVIAREWRDPLARRVTLTHAEVARDLSSARIYFTLLGGGDVHAAEAALNQAGPFLRKHLAARVHLRTLPALRFRFDEAVERGARLAALIERARAEDSGEGDTPSQEDRET
jgi:ribosome-binding factor A